MSVTRDVISAISKGPCAALLSQAGFRRSSPHFWRDEKDINHAVNFQASQWGSQESGGFTINLGVSSRALYEGFTGRRFPSNRGTALWPISVRIGGLMNERTDRWWNVESLAQADAIGEEVVASLRQYGLPFFEALRTREQLADWVQTPVPRFRVFPAQVPLIPQSEILHATSTHGQLRKAVRSHGSSSCGHAWYTTR